MHENFLIAGRRRVLLVIVIAIDIVDIVVVTLSQSEDVPVKIISTKTSGQL
jgi:hypothetical protein